MKKTPYFRIACCLSGLSYCMLPLLANADPVFGTVTPNVNDTYIHSQSYLQNPFLGQPSGGGTQFVAESQLATDGLMKTLFSDGTWNVQGFGGLVQNTNGPAMYSLSSTLFGQTGAIGGFSFGGAFTLANPVLTPGINPPRSSSSSMPTLTSDQQYVPTEAYVEYQYSHIVQADAGWIGITNSPFLASNYYDNQSTGVNYQGVSVNVNPMRGWLFTAIGFNAAQYAGQNGFNSATLYNTANIYGIGNSYYFNGGDDPTFAVGSSYYTPDNNYNLRVWAYDLKNKAQLVYADNSLKLPIAEKTYFTLAAQGGFERGNNMVTVATNQSQDINSNFVGAQAGFRHNWFGISAGYNNVWGPDNAFGGGALVSPYTFNENVDPLYTNSWMTGFVQKGSAGEAFIVSPAFYFLDDNLSFTPSYSVSNSTNAPSSQEYDFIATYNIPQIKGLKIFGMYGYQTMPTTAPITGNGNTDYAWTTWLVTSYLY